MKRLARFGLHHLGGLQSVLWYTRAPFRLLMYHRFSRSLYPNGPEILDRQCEFLKRNFEVMGLGEIVEALDRGASLPPRTLAITVDDGYRDFYTDAFPLFKKWKIPAIVYLISDFIDGNSWPWWDKVEYAVAQSQEDSVSVRLNGAAQEIPLRSPAEKQSADATLRARLTRVSKEDLAKFVDQLGEVFQVEIPCEPPAESAALSWDEVRRLAHAGMEFGAHTRTHPILPALQDETAMEEEIAGSKARIEEELQEPVIHFCYPNGDWDSQSEQVVARSGFASAVITEPGLNHAGASRYRLKRLSVDLGLSNEYFREQVAGMHDRVLHPRLL